MLVLVINLDRSVDRLARIAQQLAAIGLAWTRIRAVDGRELSAAQMREVLDADGFARHRGMTPFAGEVGCYLSHVEAMRCFMNTNAPAALILEDDVRLGPDLPAVLDALMAHPMRWDMVKLSKVHSGSPVKVLTLDPGHALAVMLSRCTGSSAYVINRRAAQAYLKDLLPISLPYDHAFDQGWRFGLAVRLVVPSPCLHDDQVATTIDSGGMAASRRFHWTRRGPTYAFRLRNECRRVAYALASLWRESSWRASASTSSAEGH